MYALKIEWAILDYTALLKIVMDGGFTISMYFNCIVQ